VRENQKRNIDPGKHANPETPDGTDLGTLPESVTTDPNTLRVPVCSLRPPHLLGMSSLIAFLDQITKWIVINFLDLHESVQVIPGIVSMTRIHNSGIAFGLFPGLSNLFMIITLVSMLVVVYFYLSVEPRGVLLTVGCALILGGALGNLIDRFRFGYVVDFINFSFWPAFNIADSSVSIGVALLLVTFFREKKGPA
jgi:signal peptidase II